MWLQEKLLRRGVEGSRNRLMLEQERERITTRQAEEDRKKAEAVAKEIKDKAVTYNGWVRERKQKEEREEREREEEHRQALTAWQQSELQRLAAEEAKRQAAESSRKRFHERAKRKSAEHALWRRKQTLEAEELAAAAAVHEAELAMAAAEEAAERARQAAKEVKDISEAASATRASGLKWIPVPFFGS